MRFQVLLLLLVWVFVSCTATPLKAPPGDQRDQPEISGTVNLAGRLPPGVFDEVVISAYPPPIDDGWSVSRHPDDRRFPVAADGTFEATWPRTEPGFHRLRAGKQTLEMYLSPGARAEVVIDKEGTITFSGDHAPANRYLLESDKAISAYRRNLLAIDSLKEVYSLNAPAYDAEMAERQKAFVAQQAANATVDGAVVRRVRTDIDAAFDTFRLFYPTLFRKFTGKPASVGEDYYHRLVSQASPRAEELSSRRMVIFLDTFADFESAGAHRFGDLNRPREKLMSRYQAIKSMPAEEDVKTYLFDQMFQTFDTNYGPADWGRVLIAFANDYPKHPLVASVKKVHAQKMAVRSQANDIRVFRTVDGVDLEAHLFLPEAPAAEGRAAFVTLHGGGWAIGTPEWSYPIAQRMAAQGLVAISFEYRLADVHGSNMFAAMEDTRRAIEWVRAHAAELGIDPNRVVAHGFSAGAHLVGINAILAEKATAARPNALILHSSTYNTTKSGFFTAMTDGQPGAASLTHQIKPGLVPTLLIHGKYDHLAPEAEFMEFVGRMKELENDFEYRVFEVGHFFRNDAARQQVVQLTDQFLKARGFLE